MLKNCFPLPPLPTLYKTSPLLQRKEPPQEIPGSPVVKNPHFHCRVCRLHPGWRTKILQISVQFGSVAQPCPTLCDPMNRSTPGLPVHHQLLESTQTHVHRVADAIQPSHPLSSPSPPAPNPSQHQGLFKWVSSSHQLAKILGVSASASVHPMNTQDWSPLGWTGWISLQSKGLSRVFSSTTVQKHQFFGAANLGQTKNEKKVKSSP